MGRRRHTGGMGRRRLEGLGSVVGSEGEEAHKWDGEEVHRWDGEEAYRWMGRRCTGGWGGGIQVGGEEAYRWMGRRHTGGWGGGIQVDGEEAYRWMGRRHTDRAVLKNSLAVRFKFLLL